MDSNFYNTDQPTFITQRHQIPFPASMFKSDSNHPEALSVAEPPPFSMKSWITFRLRFIGSPSRDRALVFLVCLTLLYGIVQKSHSSGISGTSY